MSFVKDLLGVFFLEKLVGFGGRERGVNLYDGGDSGQLLMLIMLIAIEKQVQEDKCKIEQLERRDRHCCCGQGQHGHHSRHNCNHDFFVPFSDCRREHNDCCSCHGGGFFPGQFR